MSRTYKTDPIRVKIFDNRDGDFPVKHNHADGVCDIEENSGEILFYSYEFGKCAAYYGYYSKQYIKHRARYSTYRDILRTGHRAERTRVRNALSQAKYFDADGLEDFDLTEYKGNFDIMWELL